MAKITGKYTDTYASPGMIPAAKAEPKASKAMCGKSGGARFSGHKNVRNPDSHAMKLKHC